MATEVFGASSVLFCCLCGAVTTEYNVIHLKFHPYLLFLYTLALLDISVFHIT